MIKENNDRRLGYFYMKPCIAGIDHGVLYHSTIADLIKARIEKVLGEYSEEDKSNVDKLKEYRKNIFGLIEKTQSGTEALDKFARMIFEARHIREDIDRLSKRLDYFNAEIINDDNRTNNKSISILTQTNASLALLSVIISFVGYVRWNYPLWQIIIGVTIVITIVYIIFVFIRSIYQKKNRKD